MVFIALAVIINNLYHETFKRFVFDAYNQFIDKIRQIVEEWMYYKLEVLAISVNAGAIS